MANKNKVFILGLIGVFLSQVCIAQFSNSHPCSFGGVSCDDAAYRDGFIYSFEEDTFQYSAAGSSMPFWLAVGEPDLRIIDTTFVSPVVANVLNGPGVLNGSLAQNLAKYVYFNDWSFTESGLYEIEISISGSFKDTVFFNVTERIDLCAEVTKGCGRGGGDLIFPLAGNGGIIPVDAIFPITMGVYNSTTEQLDTSFYNYGYLTQISGPGNMYGTFNMYGGPWLTFNDIRFDAVGIYTVEMSSVGNSYTPDTITVTVVAPDNVFKVKSATANVFPNPFSDKINVELKAGEILESVKIYNNQGQVLQSFPTVGLTTFDVSDLSVGVYFIEVKIQGSTTFQKGVIIKK